MTKKEATAYSQQTFESIKHTDENGTEFWYARELQVALEYTEWRSFEKSIKRAKEACTASGFIETDQKCRNFVNFRDLPPFSLKNL